MRNSGAEIIGGLVGIALLGVGTWGSYAIGAALGFYGTFGFLTGAGVIAAGILALCVVGVGLYCAGVACKAAYTTTRDYFHSLSVERAARREQAQIAANTQSSTRAITQNLTYNTASSTPATPSAPSSYTSNMYPPLYQQPQSTRDERDNPYYAPPAAYRSF